MVSKAKVMPPRTVEIFRHVSLICNVSVTSQTTQPHPLTLKASQVFVYRQQRR